MVLELQSRTEKAGDRAPVTAKSKKSKKAKKEKKAKEERRRKRQEQEGNRERKLGEQVLRQSRVQERKQEEPVRRDQVNWEVVHAEQKRSEDGSSSCYDGTPSCCLSSKFTGLKEALVKSASGGRSNGEERKQQETPR